METASQPGPTRAAAALRWSAVSPLIAAVLVMLTCLTLSRAPSDLKVDTDTSLSAVLNYAHQHHLQFGPDLVCTYGPLGYLVFFYYSPHAAGVRLAVEVALCLMVSVGLCRLAWRLPLVWRCLLLGVFVFLAANVETRTDLVIDTGFLCWGLLCFVECGPPLSCACSGTQGVRPELPSSALPGTLSPSDGEREGVRGTLGSKTVWPIVAAAAFTILAAFGALAKASILFSAALNVTLVAVALGLRRQSLWGLGMLAAFGACFALGWVAGGQGLSNIGSYLVNALAVVRGYNLALGWEALPSVTWAGIAVMLLASGVGIIRVFNVCGTQEKHRAWHRALLLTWMASLLFLSWKHGLARGDAYHVAYFFGFVPVLVLALEVLPCSSGAARFWARGLGALACLLSILTLQSFFFPPVMASLEQPFRNFGYYATCLFKPGAYCQRMDEEIAAKQDEARLAGLRERIGRARVDVFGNNAVYAIFNDLNYRPRPVFLSYLACTPWLMGLNEQFYLSPAAPEYVMFSLGGIDRKFAPLEDALVLRHLLINYKPAGGEGDFVLLRRQTAEPARLNLLREGTVRPGERIDFNGFGATNLWLELDLAPSLIGRLREFLYRPPPVRLAAWREPGKGLLARRRAPAPMLAAGFLASPLLLRNENTLDLYDGRPVSRPAAYSVELLPGQEHFWHEAIRFRVYAIHNLRTFPAR